MTNKAEDEIDESIKIGPGDLLAFGSINLLLTLNLDKNDLSKYKIEWEDLKTLKDLRFIRKHKHFWKRVELSSNDNTMNILLNINKTSKKLIKIGYVGLKKMVFKEKQIHFQDLIMSVTKQNGLYITSCDVCKCTISVQLLLKYENDEKIFLLSGKSTEIKKPGENKKENNEEVKNNMKIKKMRIIIPMKIKIKIVIIIKNQMITKAKRIKRKNQIVMKIKKKQYLNWKGKMMK